MNFYIKQQLMEIQLMIFIKKCENKGPTILIVKSNKGQIFGGYTEKNWIKDKSL